jgi:hypothetical protein
MKSNKLIILLLFLLPLAGLMASASPAKAQAETTGTLAAYGLQLTYTIQGAVLGPPSDTTTNPSGAVTVTRAFTGTLSGGVLYITGTFGTDAASAGGVYTALNGASGYASVGTAQDEYTYSTGDTHYTLSVSIPSPIPPEGGTFDISVTGQSSSGSYELRITGNLAGGIQPPPPPVTTTTGVACDPNDPNQYTQVGANYRVAFSGLQADRTSYAPGDTMVISGAVDFEQSGVLVDQNCPEPYPTANSNWSPADPTQVTITIQGVSRSYAVAQDGSFSITLSIPSNAAAGTITLQVTATGPSSMDGTPTAATRTLSVGVSAPSVTTTSTSSSTAETTCDQNDQSQYTQDGYQYEVAFLNSLQVDKPSYAPGDTVVVSGAVNLKQRDVLIDQNCPEPYPTTYGYWTNVDPSDKVTVSVNGPGGLLLGGSLSVPQDGSFSIDFSLGSGWSPGDNSLQVTATGPRSNDGTPTTTTQTLTIDVQSTTVPGPSSGGSGLLAAGVIGILIGAAAAVSVAVGALVAVEVADNAVILRVGLWIARTPGVGWLAGVVYNGLYRTTTIGVPLLKAGYDGVVKGIVEPIEDGRFARWYEKPHGP